MIEEGKITKIRNNIAHVKLIKGSMCNSCGSRAGCQLFSHDRVVEIEAMNKVKGKVGDYILLNIKSEYTLKISFLVYIFPIIALVAGAILGNNISKKYFSNSEITSIIFALIGFTFSFIIIKQISKIISKKKQKYIPEIIKILS